MKVNIGPYRRIYSMYELLRWTRFIGVSEDTAISISEWLEKTFVQKVLDFVNDSFKRRVKLTIHPYDTWNLDHTLALIILPCLIQLKEEKNGAPYVDDQDVPENLQSTSPDIPKKENDWDLDDNFFKRWEWVINEMIFAFECLSDPDRFLYDPKTLDRVNNGVRLFGKYYRNLYS
jgi:hypothetical protein